MEIYTCQYPQWDGLWRGSILLAARSVTTAGDDLRLVDTYHSLVNGFGPIEFIMVGFSDGGVFAQLCDIHLPGRFAGVVWSVTIDPQTCHSRPPG